MSFQIFAGDTDESFGGMELKAVPSVRIVADSAAALAEVRNYNPGKCPRSRAPQSPKRSRLRAQFFQVGGEELGDFFEAADVVGIYRHERLMRLKAGGGHFLLARPEASMLALLTFRHYQRALGQFKQMQHPEVFQQFRDSWIGIEQFNGAIFGFMVAGIHLQTQAGE